MTALTSDKRYRELLEAWRAEADRFRQLGLEQPAAQATRYADELAAAVQASRYEELDLESAAFESGYTRSALEKMMRRGDLTNAGEKGRPRVRRCDLPCKPGTRSSGPDLAELVWSAGDVA